MGHGGLSWRFACALSAVGALAAAPTPVLAADASDEVTGIGMPIIILILLACLILGTQTHLMEVFSESKKNTLNLLCFICSVLNLALSILLYFSTAYNYGLVITVLSYSVAILKPNETFAKHSKSLMIAYFVGFLFLLGFPSAWGPGIIVAINTGDCSAFYLTYAYAMCADGWLTCMKIVACVTVGSTLFILLLLIATVLRVEESLVSSVVGVSAFSSENVLNAPVNSEVQHNYSRI